MDRQIFPLIRVCLQQRDLQQRRRLPDVPPLQNVQGLEHVGDLHYGQGKPALSGSDACHQHTGSSASSSPPLPVCRWATCSTTRARSSSASSCPSGPSPSWSTGRGRWPRWLTTGTAWTSMRKRCHTPVPVGPFSSLLSYTLLSMFFFLTCFDCFFVKVNSTFSRFGFLFFTQKQRC